MSDDSKKIIRETSRWLRVGFLTISVLGPVIETVASRLRQRSVALRDEATKRSTVAYQQSQARLAATGNTLADTVGNLRADAYRQELLKRGGDLTEDLIGRGSKLSQVVVERGGKVGRDLAERGSKATQVAVERSNDVLQDLTERSEKASRELAKRTERASKDITKRGKEVSKEVTKRSQKATRELQKRSQAAQRELVKRTEQIRQQERQRNNPLMLAFGFSISLVAAAIAVYLLVKRRLDRYAQNDAQLHIVQNGSLNGSSRNTSYSEPRSATQATTGTVAPALTLVEPVTSEPVVDPVISTEPRIEESEAATEKMPVISIQGMINAQPSTEEETLQPGTTESAEDVTSSVIPADAKYLAIVATKTYYPIETPLDTLPAPEDGALEVVYFVTAEEAQAQGYNEVQ